MKKIIILFFLTILIIYYNIYSNEINNYDIELVKIINKGRGQNELIWTEYSMPGEPSTFNINNGDIYIIDSYNKRIVLYDSNFNFKQILLSENNTINKIQNEIFFSQAIKFDNYGNYYLLHDTTGIYKININGLIYYIPNSSIIHNDTLNFDDFFLIDSYVFIKKDSDNFVIVNNEGNIFKDEKAWEIIEGLKGFGEGIFNNDIDLQKKFKLFLKTNSLLHFNGKTIENNFDKFLIYREFIFKNFKEKVLKDKIKINYDEFGFNFHGFDKKNNLYWWARKHNTFFDLYMIFNKYGELIDVFYDKTSSRTIAVNNNGDIYFMKIAKEGMGFYRIRNTWDPIDPPDTTTTQPTKPQVTAITASSYNTYKNLYHPLKAFDGDIKTAWLEAAKGPGIGEYISLELDKEITVDSIQVLPGFFDTKWWKSNNRVKTLIMKTGDDTTTLKFQDTMQPHKADFKEPKTFKKVEFIIQEVYPSGKDDDTAISEIQFYYKGENIKLDFSKQEAELKKAGAK